MMRSTSRGGRPSWGTIGARAALAVVLLISPVAHFVQWQSGVPARMTVTGDCQHSKVSSPHCQGVLRTASQSGSPIGQTMDIVGTVDGEVGHDVGVHILTGSGGHPHAVADRSLFGALPWAGIACLLGLWAVIDTVRRLRRPGVPTADPYPQSGSPPPDQL